jgi:2-oxoglutarate dehydrogenase E1 component
MASTYSAASDLTEGRFNLVLADPAAPDPEGVERVVFCTGKFAHELIAKRDETGAPVAIVRLEQLFPWPENEITAELVRYLDAEVIWAQEEPGNMGARYFARRRIEEIAGGRPVGVVARSASSSPATGSSTVHEVEQNRLLADALGLGV